MADFNSARQSDARRAYGDHDKSVEVHGKKMETFNVDIRKNGAMRNRALILSALAGLCGAAGVGGAVAGAPHLFQALAQPRNAMKMAGWSAVTGLAAALVATGAFSFERSIYDLELRRELWEIENHLTGELQEMIFIYKSQGLSEVEATTVTHIFAKQKMLFANLMMVEELGYSRLEPPLLPEIVSNVGVPTVVGYMIGLMTPLLPTLLSSTATTAVISNSSSNGDGSDGITRAVSAAAVAIGGALVSVVQTEVFFGSYARVAVVARTVGFNTACLGTVFMLSYAAARFL